MTFKSKSADHVPVKYSPLTSGFSAEDFVAFVEISTGNIRVRLDEHALEFH